MIQTKWLIPVAMVIALAVGCSKDRVAEEEESLNEYQSTDAFCDQYKQPEQEYTVDGEGEGPIIGTSGTRLWVDSSMFMHQDGSDVSYPFTIKLVELYTAKDMILWRMPTVASGSVISSGGEIRVRAFKGTEELLLKPSKVWYAQMPTTAPDTAMTLFLGTASGTIVNWAPNTNPLGSLSPFTDSTGATFHQLFSPAMGWINCDKFYNYPGGTTSITFTSTTDDLTNVAKFLYFPAIHSVMQVYGTTSGSVPVGDNVVVICFAANTSGTMHLYSQNLSIASGQSVDVVMASSSESAVLGFLGGL